MFFHASGPTLTRTLIVRRASAVLTPGILRTTCTRSSLNDSVSSVALGGCTDIQVSVRSRIKITREPPTMPIANTPTAIESTTSSVRVLLLHRSRSTLRQRGLSMGHLPLARGAVFDKALLRDAINRQLGWFGIGDQATKLGAVKRHNFNIRLARSADSGGARAAAQQADLAEILAGVHCRNGDRGAVRLVQLHFNLAFGDDVKLVGRFTLADDRRAGSEAARFELARHQRQLIHR